MWIQYALIGVLAGIQGYRAKQIHISSHDPNSLSQDDLNSIVQDNIKPGVDYVETPEMKVDAAFARYVDSNGYYGATMGVLYGDRMVYAGGKGTIYGMEAEGDTLVPILGLSKTLTATAIYKLVEIGALELSDTVFGKNGLLKMLEAPSDSKPDKRLFKITVDHLLHHTGGWDETQGPVYDPMLNTLLVAMDQGNVDIAKEMGIEGMVNQYDIIKFMLTKPLHFEPGTKVRSSNFGYCVLGRIIEEVTGLTYDYWVKQNILVPAGMWHTRLGPPPNQVQSVLEKQDKTKVEQVKVDLENDQHPDLSSSAAMYDILHPEIVDSTLGWYSTVYDVGRLFLCLFKSGITNEFALLEPGTLEFAMTKPQAPFPTKNLRWPGLGFTVTSDGTFYMESTDPKQGLDVFFYHKQSDQYGSEKKTRGKRDAFSFDYVDDATVIFMGYTYKHHKHMRDLAKIILEPLTPDIYLHNALLQDLGDNEVFTQNHDVLIKYKLPEQKLLALANAMRMAGFYPKWIHGYSFAGHSYFITIFERATEMEQLYFKVYVSPSKKHLIKFIANNVDKQYVVSFVQSFQSASHDGRMTHVVMMSLRTDFDTLRQFDFEQPLTRYMGKMADHQAIGYQIKIQSVEIKTSYDNNDEKHEEPEVTYLMETTINKNHTLDHTYMDLSFEELQTISQSNAQEGYGLTYLDTYSERRTTEPKFSAVFGSNPYYQWVLLNDVNYDRLQEEVEKWSNQRFIPRLLAAYERDGELHFAGLWAVDPKDNGFETGGY